MKNTLSKLALLVAAFLPVVAVAQTATTSTTLASAVSDAQVQQIVVASVTNILAPTVSHSGSKLYIDREVMDVEAVNSTTITVVRGVDGTRALPHVSGATVYVNYSTTQGGQPAFRSHPPNAGGCTATNEVYLPLVTVNPFYDGAGTLADCFNGKWEWNLNLPLYTFTVAPDAQRSAATPTAGAVVSLTAQAGGAQSATTGNGAAGGASSLVGGAGGAGGSSSGTGGAGGGVNVTGGAGAGTITGGAGGSVTIKAGAGANGTSAGGSGGSVILQAGAVGTGGTGVAGKVQIKDAADATKVVALDVSGVTTATTRSYNMPDGSSGIPLVYECGATGTGNQTCAPAAGNAKTQIYNGSSTLSSNAAIITFPNAFTSTTSYFCVANDITTRANPVQMLSTSSTTATITNTTGASDVIQWTCIGQ